MNTNLILAAFLLYACTAYANENYPAKGTGESQSKEKVGSYVMHAEIISVDISKSEVNVLDKVTGNRLNIGIADPSTLHSFSTGDRVRITFPTSDRTRALSVVAEEKPTE